MISRISTLCVLSVLIGGYAAEEGAVAETSPESSARSGCHPSYDPCVPIADDVDCAGGGGDGPGYVVGPIKVIGPDEYRLDSNGDGVGCER